jgi:hypothetical protein
MNPPLREIPTIANWIRTDWIPTNAQDCCVNPVLSLAKAINIFLFLKIERGRDRTLPAERGIYPICGDTSTQFTPCCRISWIGAAVQL